MNARAYLALEVVINNHFFRLEMPQHAPLSDGHEAVKQFATDLVELEKLIIQQKAAAQAQQPVEAQSAA